MDLGKNGGVELISIKSLNVDKMADTKFKDQSGDRSFRRSEINSEDEDGNDIKLVGASHSDKVRPNHYDWNERHRNVQIDYNFAGNSYGRDVSGCSADDHIFRRHSTVS